MPDTTPRRAYAAAQSTQQRAVTNVANNRALYPGAYRGVPADYSHGYDGRAYPGLTSTTRSKAPIRSTSPAASPAPPAISSLPSLDFLSSALASLQRMTSPSKVPPARREGYASASTPSKPDPVVKRLNYGTPSDSLARIESETTDATSALIKNDTATIEHEAPIQKSQQRRAAICLSLFFCALAIPLIVILSIFSHQNKRSLLLQITAAGMGGNFINAAFLYQNFTSRNLQAGSVTSLLSYDCSTQSPSSRLCKLRGLLDTDIALNKTAEITTTHESTLVDATMNNLAISCTGAPQTTCQFAQMFMQNGEVSNTLSFNMTSLMPSLG